MLTIFPLSRLLCFDTNNPDAVTGLSHGTDVPGVSREQNVNNARYCYEHILNNTEVWSVSCNPPSCIETKEDCLLNDELCSMTIS
jgi:hypothetical protein